MQLPQQIAKRARLSRMADSAFAFAGMLASGKSTAARNRAALVGLCGVAVGMATMAFWERLSTALGQSLLVMSFCVILVGLGLFWRAVFRQCRLRG
jgi:hypothetical protein